MLMSLVKIYVYPILYSWSRQLRFSLYGGAVITRAQFIYNTFISDSFLAP